MKDRLKHYWWVFLILLGLPILLNFIVFKPTSQLSAGNLQDWISFWGNYLGATISALVAFIILYIQQKDHKQEVELNRLENQRENGRSRLYAHQENAQIVKENKLENNKNRQLQLNVLSNQLQVQWLSELRKAFANHICAYRENDIKEIINSTFSSTFESVQEKIKALYDNLALTDTVLGLVIVENPHTMIGDTYKREQEKLYSHYMSIIKDIQLLICLYYNKTPISNDVSDFIVAMKIDSKSFSYDQFSELAHQIIKPLPNIFEAIRELSIRCIKDERQRINKSLNDSLNS